MQTSNYELLNVSVGRGLWHSSVCVYVRVLAGKGLFQLQRKFYSIIAVSVQLRLSRTAPDMARKSKMMKPRLTGFSLSKAERTYRKFDRFAAKPENSWSPLSKPLRVQETKPLAKNPIPWVTTSIHMLDTPCSFRRRREEMHSKRNRRGTTSLTLPPDRPGAGTGQDMDHISSPYDRPGARMTRYSDLATPPDTNDREDSDGSHKDSQEGSHKAGDTRKVSRKPTIKKKGSQEKIRLTLRQQLVSGGVVTWAVMGAGAFVMGAS